MEKILTLLAAVLMAAIAFAQAPKAVGAIEGEISAGITYPLGDFHEAAKAANGSYGLELRYNFPGTGWDLGVLGFAKGTSYEIPMLGGDAVSTQTNMSTGLMLTGDYNFCQGYKVNPYVGIGAGFANNLNTGYRRYDCEGYTAAFRPRVGVELWSHLRVSADATITRTGYNSFGLTLGLVLGGSDKK